MVCYSLGPRGRSEQDYRGQLGFPTNGLSNNYAVYFYFRLRKTPQARCKRRSIADAWVHGLAFLCTMHARFNRRKMGCPIGWVQGSKSTPSSALSFVTHTLLSPCCKPRCCGPTRYMKEFVARRRYTGLEAKGKKDRKNKCEIPRYSDDAFA
jgi:hypothetical protein